LEADVSSSAAITEAIARFRAQVPHVDIAVACAGIAGRRGTVLDDAEDEWDRVMAVNAKGVYLTARAVFPAFVDQAEGSFVAIADGPLGARGWAVYSAAKHAVLGLIRALAVDFADRGIRSNAVCPGFIHTPMSVDDLADPEAESFWLDTIPLGRFGEPDEVARVVEFLALPSASYMTGCLYPLDGGAHAAFNYGR
jgi:NAD(P)-dependent dehydrogenase (short-subunit alcohol dehydrogenase family)